MYILILPVTIIIITTYIAMITPIGIMQNGILQEMAMPL